jgi:hypothetical protein
MTGCHKVIMGLPVTVTDVAPIFWRLERVMAALRYSHSRLGVSPFRISPIPGFWGNCVRRLHHLRDDRGSGCLRWALRPFAIESELASNAATLIAFKLQRTNETSHDVPMHLMCHSCSVVRRVKLL